MKYKRISSNLLFLLFLSFFSCGDVETSSSEDNEEREEINVEFLIEPIDGTNNLKINVYLNGESGERHYFTHVPFIKINPGSYSRVKRLADGAYYIEAYPLFSSNSEFTIRVTGESQGQEIKTSTNLTSEDVWPTQ